MNQEFLQKLSRLIQTRRVSWKVQVEDNVLKVATGSVSIEWDIITEICTMFKCNVRDIQSNQNTLIITLVAPADGST